MATEAAFIPWDRLKPGMIFVNAAVPTQRLVVLKILSSSPGLVWGAIVGEYEPKLRRWGSFYFTPLTPTNKIRRTGWYLDPLIPGNLYFRASSPSSLHP